MPPSFRARHLPNKTSQLVTYFPIDLTADICYYFRMMQILVLLFILTMSLGVGLILVHPLVCLRACWKRPDFTSRQRNFWFILILLTVPVGNIVYALWRSSDLHFRALTIQALAAFTISFLALLGTSYLVPTPLDQFASSTLEIRPQYH